ncbi:MAG: phosphoenolpyruvate--protein phosphotransferase [Candidatus Eisenbacteria bacterium]|nr:phosphoenolpyruvate--protein phosphotransferase [Candidatus Eisenbacteria bacterium]
MSGETWYDGVAASPGIVIAEARRFVAKDIDVEETVLAPDDITDEISRFRRAIDDARQELNDVRATTAELLDEEHAQIFDTHLSILDDPMAFDDTIGHIRSEKKGAAWLFRRNLSRIADALEQRGDPYFSERAQDIRDVKRRVLRRLLGAPDAGRPVLDRPGILVAHEISPSDAVFLDPRIVLGLVLDIGGRTSHAAIMARSRGIPAVSGLDTTSHEINSGDMLILDGLKGRVISNPLEETLFDYRRRLVRWREAEVRCEALLTLPAETIDGRMLTLAANMEMPEEADQALARGAMGVGLFRTEFFLVRHHRFPDEEIQYQAYRSVVEKMAPWPVIIRTLDVGGDKFASYLGAAPEDNPFLGMRGIRFLPDHRELFRSQIRAAYRASGHGKVKILLPMVSGLEEVRHMRALCAQVMTELTAEQKAFDPEVELGIMVEVPSTVILADLLARETDFFSIGSNDLIQYTLAVDRGSSRVAHLYEPLHPAVLRSIRRVVDVAHAEGRWVGICGEMAGDPTAAVLLIGLGLDEFSVGSSLLPEVKRVIRGVSYAEARGWADHAATLATALEVRGFMEPLMNQRFADILGDTGNGNGSPHAATGVAP